MSVRLADRLAAARRRGFVGRDGQLARFRELLAGTAEPRVVFVYGPGGVGKTALLHQFAWLGEQAGRRTAWLDGRETPPVAATVVRALCDELGCEPDAIEQVGDIVLLIDTFEALTPLDRWLRDELLPGLPAEAVVVLAGRERPSLGWLTDPGWRELLERMPLDNLSMAEGHELLSRRGVPGSQRDEALAFTRGHPLALALVADVSAQRPFSPTTAPEVVSALLKSFVDAVPTAAHRRALEACAQVLALTEPLLAALLDHPRPSELFGWLRDLSIIEHGPRGLFPHDLVRDVLAAEVGWRDPDGCAEIRTRAAAYFRDRFRTASPAARQRILLDLIYLHRDRSVLGPFLGGVSPRGIDAGRFAVTAATSAEWPLLRSWVERHEGPESARLFDHWRLRCPDATLVIREGHGSPAGFCTVLSTADIAPDDRRIDPAADRVSFAHDFARDRDARLVRFWMARDTYQALSPVQTFITLYLFRSYLGAPSPAATYLTFANPGFWGEACAHLDFDRLPEADYKIDGRHYGVYWHDWRTVPPTVWLTRLAERETGHPLPLPGPPQLDEPAFAEAVRDALRNLGRADGLRGSVLLNTHLVTIRAGAAAAEPERIAALRQAIQDAAAELADSPHDRRAYRALHHTYLQPAGTQQNAADLLRLPMSTYRRHLATGIDRLTTLLWQQEQDPG